MTDSYKFRVEASDSIRISISHKTLNWNEFLTVDFESRYYGKENNNRTEVSHGTGGFNKADTLDIVNAKIEMLTFAKILVSVFSDAIFETLKNINKVNEKIYNVTNSIRNIEAEENILEQRKQLEENFIKIDSDKVISFLANGGNLKLNTILKGASDISFWNVSYNSNTKILYVRNNMISKKDLISFIDNNEFYVEK